MSQIPKNPIRAAQPDDAAELARLAAELGYPTPAAEMRRRLGAVLGDPHHHVVVVEGSGRGLLGWAHVEHRQSLEGAPRAELVGLVVDAAARQQGVGRALVGAVEQWARSCGLRSLTVRSNVARVESHLFYAALGYARDKTQHVYVKRPLTE